MEFSRFSQVKDLTAQGWTRDALCQDLQRGQLIFGGPTYMRAPDGRYHAVASNAAPLLDGAHRTEAGEHVVFNQGRDTRVLA